MQSLTRLVILLLKDDRTKEIRPYLESILNSISSFSFTPDFKELFEQTGLDSVTQSWMLYEFSRGRITNQASGKERPESSRGDKKPQEELKLVEVKDLGIVETWGCDPKQFSFEELYTLYVHMLDKVGVIDYFNIPR